MCLLTPQQETKCDPPSTSFSRAVRLCPLRDSAALGSLRSPSLRLAPEGAEAQEQRQFTETLLHPLGPPDQLLSRVGEFDIGAAMQRVAGSPFSRATRENPYPDRE